MTVNRYGGSQFTEVRKVGYGVSDAFVDASVKVRRSDGTWDEIWPSWTVVEDWERTTPLDDYSGSTASFTVQGTTVYEGGNAVSPDSNFVETISTSGLPKYPSQGDTFDVRVYAPEGGGASSSTIQWFFGVQDIDNGYLPVWGPGNGLALLVKDGGNFSEIASDPNASDPRRGEWLRMEVAWGTDDTIELTAFLEDGTEDATVSVTDATYSSGGIGFRGGNQCHYDYLRIL